MEKRKIYFAQRIIANQEDGCILGINTEMTVDEIKELYFKKIIEKEKYIHNGHWILRPVKSEDSFNENLIPKNVKPYHIWEMVKTKIKDSDAMIAVIDLKSYGTIAEIGYASGLGSVAVYVLPDLKLNEFDIQDLWLVFQKSLNTSDLWNENDIVCTENFKKHNINSIEEYRTFIERIIPNFLKN